MKRLFITGLFLLSSAVGYADSPPLKFYLYYQQCTAGNCDVHLKQIPITLKEINTFPGCKAKHGLATESAEIGGVKFPALVSITELACPGKPQEIYISEAVGPDSNDETTRSSQHVLSGPSYESFQSGYLYGPDISAGKSLVTADLVHSMKELKPSDLQRYKQLRKTLSNKR